MGKLRLRVIRPVTDRNRLKLKSSDPKTWCSLYRTTLTIDSGNQKSPQSVPFLPFWEHPWRRQRRGVDRRPDIYGNPSCGIVPFPYPSHRVNRLGKKGVQRLLWDEPAGQCGSFGLISRGHMKAVIHLHVCRNTTGELSTHLRSFLQKPQEAPEKKHFAILCGPFWWTHRFLTLWGHRPPLSKFQCASESPRGLEKTQTLGLHPPTTPTLWFSRCRRGLRTVFLS